MAVDWLRSCYSTTIRPYKDSNLEVPIEWYFTDPHAPFLPFAHAFVSRNWEDVKDWVLDIGETPAANRPWKNGKTPSWVHNDFFGDRDTWFNGMALADRAGVPLNADGSDPRCAAGPVCQFFDLPRTLFARVRWQDFDNTAHDMGPLPLTTDNPIALDMYTGGPFTAPNGAVFACGFG